MKHTECEDCKLRNGDCGYHFKMNGKTNYDIPSLSACDRYGNCEFFQQKEKPQGDLISREALREDLRRFFPIEVLEGIEPKALFAQIMHDIDNAPTVLFPLTVKINDNVTDEDIETLKRLMADYKPQILNLETEKPQGNQCEMNNEKRGSIMADKIKQAVADEFKYRASQGRTNYSMEEVIQIVGEVIDEVDWENKK